MAHTCSCHGESRVEFKKTVAAVTADQTVEEAAHRSPAALAVLKEMGINHCCGAHLTLREAAASAGVETERLLKAVNEALGAAAPKPAVLAALPAERQVHVDVRDDIRRGQEPFARIMAAVKALRPGEVLVLRAPFEPIPLYDVLGKRGFSHWTERRDAADWSVWFYRAGGAPAAPARAAGEREPAADAKTITIDVRGLEPPQPMVRVLELLDTLAPGQRLEVVHDRRPLFLYPQLDAQGFVHETQEHEPGLVRILIRRGS